MYRSYLPFLSLCLSWGSPAGAEVACFSGSSPSAAYSQVTEVGKMQNEGALGQVLTPNAPSAFPVLHLTAVCYMCSFKDPWGQFPSVPTVRERKDIWPDGTSGLLNTNPAAAGEHNVSQRECWMGTCWVLWPCQRPAEATASSVVALFESLTCFSLLSPQYPSFMLKSSTYGFPNSFLCIDIPKYNKFIFS